MNSGNLKIISLFFVFLIVVGLTLFTTLGDHKSSASRKEEVEGIVKNYLTENPEVVVEALEAYQQKQVKQQAEKSQASISTQKDTLERDGVSPVVGNPSGDVTIVEFFDYACGYCHKAFPSIAKLVESDPSIRVVMKEFPILGAPSVVASKAALAVNALWPEKYFAFHSALMKGDIRGGDEAIWQVAKSLSLDVDAIKKKMEDPAINKLIEDTHGLASNIGVRGTPAFVINGEFIPGYVDFETLQAKVQQARSKPAAAPVSTESAPAAAPAPAANEAPKQ